RHRLHRLDVAVFTSEEGPQRVPEAFLTDGDLERLGQFVDMDRGHGSLRCGHAMLAVRPRRCRRIRGQGPPRGRSGPCTFSDPAYGEVGDGKPVSPPVAGVVVAGLSAWWRPASAGW